MGCYVDEDEYFMFGEFEHYKKNMTVYGGYLHEQCLREEVDIVEDISAVVVAFSLSWFLILCTICCV